VSVLLTDLLALQSDTKFVVIFGWMLLVYGRQNDIISINTTDRVVFLWWHGHLCWCIYS